MSKRSWFFVSGVVLIVISVVAWGLLRPSGVQPFRSAVFSEDGAPVMLFVIDYEGGSHLFPIPLADIDNATVRHSYSQNGIVITPWLTTSGFGSRTYSFAISDNGVARDIPEFVYSGEEAVTVARGRNWYIHITTL